MSGLIPLAPIYLNGVLALLFVFVFPGIVIVRAFSVPSFPQRWFIIFLSSLSANHVLVTLIAALHFNTLQTYRVGGAALIVVLLCMTVLKGSAPGVLARQASSSIGPSDVKWLLGSIVVLGFAYFNVWRHGVPNIFEGGDVSVSWNAWSLIWSEGKFPTGSYGYPQFIPTTWAVTYIFTGSQEQYFAFYSYIVLIIAPLILCTMVLGRLDWRYPLLFLVVFVWFVAEIREPWLRATLEQGFPDWVAAIFGFCGAVLFVTNAPRSRPDREWVASALLSTCLVSIAAATKPIFAPVVLAAVIGVSADARKHLQRPERNRLILALVALVSAFVGTYAVNYSHLSMLTMPNYPVTEFSERLSRAANLVSSNFTLPFRILALGGLLFSPFLPRVRWLTLPLCVGFGLWANTASYDLRNILGLLLISAFIPVYALVRTFSIARTSANEPQWIVPDEAIAAGLAVLSIGLTLSLAQTDKELKQRFADEQLQRGLGLKLNKDIEKLLLRTCTIFTADSYIYTISAFQPFMKQLHFFHYSEPLNDLLAKQVNESTGCTSILYPPSATHPSILRFVDTYTKTRSFAKMAEDREMELLVSSP